MNPVGPPLMMNGSPVFEYYATEDRGTRPAPPAIVPPPIRVRDIDHDLEEYTIAPRRFEHLPQYFQSPHEIDFIDIELDGRPIKVYGINEDQQIEEFQQALGDIVIPVTPKEAVQNALDVHIRKALLHGFQQIQKEGNQGKKEFQIWKQPYVDLASPTLKHKELKEAIEKLPEGMIRSFGDLLPVLEKRLHFLDILTDYFIPLETVKTVLGDELYAKTLKKMPIKWKIPKEKVPTLHKCMALYPENSSGIVKEKDVMDLSEEELEMRFQSKKKADERIRTGFKNFEEIKDYYIEDRVLHFFIPITKKNLHPCPRVERVKQALRVFFGIDEVLSQVTDEMVSGFIELKKRLSEKERVSLAAHLENALVKEVKLQIFDRLGLKLPSEKEKLIFIELLKMLIPEENELLLCPSEDLDKPSQFDLTRDHIEMIAKSALNSLDLSARDAELLVQFRLRGKDMYLGAPKPRGRYILPDGVEDPLVLSFEIV